MVWKNIKRPYEDGGINGLEDGGRDPESWSTSSL